MSTSTTSHAYGIGLLTLLVGIAASVVFYQMFYLPESTAKPVVDEHVLHPPSKTDISMVPGSADPNQKENFIPKKVSVQLAVDNHVIWTNKDQTPHTVTSDKPYEDSYSGKFGSSGVVKAGETYEFVFTEEGEFEYHCEPHPWMKGTLEITKARF